MTATRAKTGAKTRAISRRSMLQAAALAPLVWPLRAAAQGRAAGYPSRDIHIVCNYAAGSGADITTRWFAGKLAELSKATVIVDNKVGAAGNIGTEFAARAKPDGHTILVTPAFTTLAGAKHVFKSLPFDPVKDFVPITTLCAAPFLIAVDPRKGFKSLADLTAFLKRKPAGKTTYGSATNTGTAASEMYKLAIGLDVLQVKYRTTADTLPDVASGQLDFIMVDAGSVMGEIRSGRLQALAWTTDYRPQSLPDVPTFIELGYQDIDMLPWWGAFAPAGTPQPIIETLGGWLNQIVAMPQTKTFLETLSVEVLAGDADRLRALLDKALVDWAHFVKVGRIEPQWAHHMRPPRWPSISTTSSATTRGSASTLAGRSLSFSRSAARRAIRLLVRRLSVLIRSGMPVTSSSMVSTRAFSVVNSRSSVATLLSRSAITRLPSQTLSARSAARPLGQPSDSIGPLLHLRQPAVEHGDHLLRPLLARGEIHLLDLESACLHLVHGAEPERMRQKLARVRPLLVEPVEALFQVVETLVVLSQLGADLAQLHQHHILGFIGHGLPPRSVRTKIVQLKTNVQHELHGIPSK